MSTVFKSALNQVKADERLLKKTEVYLMENISTKKNNSVPARRNLFIGKRVIATACAALLLCGGSLGAYAYYKTPVSYLSLDINPSVELGVNSFGKVVSATGYNADGNTILKGQNLINSSVQDAVKTLVKSADENGFIADDGSTVISATSETDNSTTADELQNEAENGANEVIDSTGDKATVQTDNVALARRDEARKLGITPGKLNLIQKLQTLDPSITVDQYKDAKVKDIMKKFVELKKQQNGSSQADSSSSEVSSSSSSETAESSSESGSSKSNPSSSKAKSKKGSSSAQNSSYTASTASAVQSQNGTATAPSSSGNTIKSNNNSKSGTAPGQSQNSHGNGTSDSSKK